MPWRHAWRVGVAPSTLYLTIRWVQWSEFLDWRKVYKMDRKYVRCEAVSCVRLVRGSSHWRAVLSTVTDIRVARMVGTYLTSFFPSRRIFVSRNLLLSSQHTPADYTVKTDRADGRFCWVSADGWCFKYFGKVKWISEKNFGGNWW